MSYKIAAADTRPETLTDRIQSMLEPGEMIECVIFGRWIDTGSKPPVTVPAGQVLDWIAALEWLDELTWSPWHSAHYDVRVYTDRRVLLTVETDTCGTGWAHAPRSPAPGVFPIQYV